MHHTLITVLSVAVVASPWIALAILQLIHRRT